jgi:hypothetical protein
MERLAEACGTGVEEVAVGARMGRWDGRRREEGGKETRLSALEARTALRER